MNLKRWIPVVIVISLIIVLLSGVKKPTSFENTSGSGSSAPIIEETLFIPQSPSLENSLEISTISLEPVPSSVPPPAAPSLNPKTASPSPRPKTTSPPSQPSIINPIEGKKVPVESPVSVTSNPPPTPPTLPTYNYSAILSSNYYCYKQLSPLQQSIYKTVYNIAYNMTSGMVRIADGAAVKDIIVAVYAMRSDYPNLFWTPPGFVYGTDRNGYMYVGFVGASINYLCTSGERDTMTEKLNTAVSSALSLLNNSMDEYTRELTLHDWIAARCTYNYAAVADPDGNLLSFSVYGALVNGSAVCEGYARALQLLLYYAGINSTLVCGDAGGPHMWNAVNINSRWYNCDLTFDDSGDKGYHAWFNLSDSIMTYNDGYKFYLNFSAQNDQYFNIGRQSCSAMDANYCMKNGTYITNGSDYQQVIVNGILAAINNGKKLQDFLFSMDSGKDTSTESSRIGSYALSAGQKITPSLIRAPGSKWFIISW